MAAAASTRTALQWSFHGHSGGLDLPTVALSMSDHVCLPIEMRDVSTEKSGALRAGMLLHASSSRHVHVDDETHR